MLTSHACTLLQGADDAERVCRRLPLVDVRWQAPRPAPNHQPADDEDAEAEPALVLSVELKRMRGPGTGGAGASRVHAPRFPKVNALCVRGLCTSLKLLRLSYELAIASCRCKMGSRSGNGGKKHGSRLPTNISIVRYRRRRRAGGWRWRTPLMPSCWRSSTRLHTFA